MFEDESRLKLSKNKKLKNPTENVFHLFPHMQMSISLQYTVCYYHSPGSIFNIYQSQYLLNAIVGALHSQTVQSVHGVFTTLVSTILIIFLLNEWDTFIKEMIVLMLLIVIKDPFEFLSKASTWKSHHCCSLANRRKQAKEIKGIDMSQWLWLRK